jgi:hypothetical protein
MHGCPRLRSRSLMKLNEVICTYSSIYNEIRIIEINTSTIIFSIYYIHIDVEGRRDCVSKSGGNIFSNKMLHINIAISV